MNAIYYDYDDEGGHYIGDVMMEHLYEDDDKIQDGEEQAKAFDDEIDESVPFPVIVWWTGFTQEKGQTKACGPASCFFTVNRRYMEHPLARAFIFYGTDFNEADLPLPRGKNHDWALMHEESPQNKYLFNHKEAMELFNYTATFKRESDLPLVTQYLQSLEQLESKKYLVPTAEKNRLQNAAGLAMVNYVQSDCGTLSDRDSVVRKLQEHISVDSYGKCLHNKDLPEHLVDPILGMDHDEFIKLQAQYKFTLAMENEVCDDYITEKFWRPLRAGSVPIVLGSSKVKDFLPSKTSAIVLDDFNTIEELVTVLKYLNENDEEYEKYLTFKSEGITNDKLKESFKHRGFAINDDYSQPNFIDAFECVVCKAVYENWQREKEGRPRIKHQATVSHYGCPEPKRFEKNPPSSLKRVQDNKWSFSWLFAKYRSQAVGKMMEENVKWKPSELGFKALKFQQQTEHEAADGR